jgi:hypothetical protein
MCYAANTVGDNIASCAPLSRGSPSASSGAPGPPCSLLNVPLSHSSPSASGGDPSPPYDGNDDDNEDETEYGNEYNDEDEKQ